MILTQPQIKDKIRKITDTTYSGFLGFPTSLLDSGDRWGDLLVTVTQNIVPTSTSHVAAKTAFKSTLIVQLPILGMAGLEAAFMAFATALGLGMSGYVATPPPPIVLASVSVIGFAGGSADACADELATLILSWLNLGTSSNISGTIAWT